MKKKAIYFLTIVIFASCNSESIETDNFGIEKKEVVQDRNKQLPTPISCLTDLSVEMFKENIILPNAPDEIYYHFNWDIGESPIPFSLNAWIELKQDINTPCPYGEYEVGTFQFPIDMVNDDELILQYNFDNPSYGDTSLECFEWRVVIKGFVTINGQLVRCDSTTDWEYFFVGWI